MDLALLLAIACMGEIDATSPHECAVMYGITAAQAERRGVSVAAQARAYYSILRRDSRGHFLVRTERARRLRALRRDSDGAGWRSVLAAADEFVAHPTRTCAADHFGSPTDRPHPTWHRVDCGAGLRQRYYSIR